MYVITVATVSVSASVTVATDAASVKTFLNITSEMSRATVSEFKRSDIPALTQFTLRSESQTVKHHKLTKTVLR